MYFLSLWIGKLIIFGLHVFGKNASALPGWVTERTNRRFLKKAMRKLPGGVIVVTGTNGKTTTTKIISELLKAQNMRVLTNNSGSNFVRGIISLVISRSSWSGKLPYDIAVIEQDEAYAVHFVQQVKPRGVVLLNVMRDQMDRFGEIDTTAGLLRTVAEQARDFVVLNADDPRLVKLGRDLRVKTVYFGHGAELAHLFVHDDAWHSTGKAKAKTVERPVVMGELQDVHEGTMTFTLDGEHLSTPIRLPGNHNALNAVAAMTAVDQIIPDVDVRTVTGTLTTIEAAFGRGEKIMVNGKALQLQLVKNPGGFRHSLELVRSGAFDHALIVINDEYADGRDVSWLWDVDYSALSESAIPVSTAGVRATDMAARLKYEEVPVTAVHEELRVALADLVADTNEQAIIFCTYTAMLALRKLLQKQGHVRAVR